MSLCIAVAAPVSVLLLLPLLEHPLLIAGLLLAAGTSLSVAVCVVSEFL